MTTATSNQSASRRNRGRSWFFLGSRRPATAESFRYFPKAIRESEHQNAALSDAQLLARATQLREQAAESYDDSLVIAYGGIVNEAIYRSHGFRLYDVQLMAVAAGADGNMVEMQTGEGKTVVTGAIAAINSLRYPSVHVATTNAYLAARDLESLESTFERLGISYGLLPEENDEGVSRDVYRRQIVYGPGYQYGFDYLRDQMNLRQNRQSKAGVATINRIRGIDPYEKLIQPADLHCALIDESDSVMIDEAMTPLIISLPKKDHEDPAPYLIAKRIVAKFNEGIEYTIEFPSKKVEVTTEAQQLAHDEIASLHELSLARPWRVYITNAIRAERTFTRDVDYVVVDDEVQIVDQNTGRIHPDRSWQDGLHQAVEAKENVPIKPGRESTTQVTRQRYLQMYDRLAGLTGTAMLVEREFKTVYRCNVVVIPTNKKSLRNVLPPRFFADQEAKIEAIAQQVVERHSTGQPILVGTRTIHETLQVNEALIARGLQATLLNGVQNEEEAEIVARAGQRGAITVATNMAGRGTDIKIEKEALEIGGLHVIGVSPNLSRRIDRQLVGRAARQGQPGSAQFFAAATDEIFVENESSLVRQIPRRAKSNGESDDFSKELDALQSMIEARSYKQRQDMILRDRWMDSVREAIEKE